ncbi:F5/8 type C domain protein [compost metagenome]
MKAITKKRVALLLSMLLLFTGVSWQPGMLGPQKVAAAAPSGLTPVAVTSSSYQNGTHAPDKAVDHDLNTRWAANGDGKPAWLQADLGTAQIIHTVRTVFEFDQSYYQYKVEVSNDGVNWIMFTDRTANTIAPGGSGYTDQNAVTGRYVRITVTANQNPNIWVSIREFEINPKVKDWSEEPFMRNVAKGKPASASSSMNADFGPDKAVDGLRGTTRWSAADNDGSHWLQVDLEKDYYVYGTRTRFEFGDAAYSYVIEASSDGQIWQTIANRSHNQALNGTGYLDDAGVSARYVRILISGSMWKSIYELEVYGTDNLAAGKIVTASSAQDDNHAAGFIVDGNKETRWASNGSGKPEWVQVDLGSSKSITRIESYFEFMDSYYQYRIELSDDGVSWQTFADRTGNTVIPNPAYTDIGQGTGRYVRLTVTGSQTTGMWSSLRELAVYQDEDNSSAGALQSGDYELRADQDSDGLYRVGVYRNAERLYFQDQPQQLLIKDDGDEPRLEEAAYTSAVLSGSKLILSGTVGSLRGSEFRFEDEYTALAEPGVFQMRRTVTVIHAANGDQGFNSRFGLIPSAQENFSQYEVLAPGNWYKKNENVVDGAMAGNPLDEFFYIREMRLALPFVMLRNEVNGETLSIGRLNASPSSDVEENTGDWLVDGSFNYGSLGIHKEARPSLDFVFPGLEGEVNYINRNDPWVRRSHPVTVGYEQNYELVLSFAQADSYEHAVAASWHDYFAWTNPEVKPIAVEILYQQAIDLMNTYYDNYNGVNGLPFKADLPSGEVSGHAMVMGFVGQQLPAAYQMIRYGIQNQDTATMNQGIAMVDFWVQHSMTASGLPKTWYEPYLNGTGGFTNQDMDMRTMSDGMEGAADAYRIMNEQGNPPADWLQYITTFGDWLVNHQNADGSYYRIYGLDGSPVHTAKYNSTNPIRFLLKLYDITGDERYKNAAIQAGNYAYQEIYQKYQYVGGTSDNNNTIDKEAGAMAMNAFLALYDATHDTKWLQALEGAAIYTATWTFSWTYHTPAGGTRWAAEGDGKPAWLQVDLGSVQNIRKIKTYMEYGNKWVQYRLETSSDGVQWSLFKDRTSVQEYGDPYYEDSGNQDARYVRVTITGTQDPGAWASIWEMVIEDASGSNLAPGSTATASSSSKSPGYAVDGNIFETVPSPYPESGLIGQSLVSTGHSYTDQYMAYMGAAYYRLYLFTNNADYLKFAKLLQNNANYTADWKGAWGYAHPGLVAEGGSVTELQYYGIGAWLLWNTVAQLEPMSILEDRFGEMDIEKIELLPLTQRKQLNDN